MGSNFPAHLLYDCRARGWCQGCIGTRTHTCVESHLDIYLSICKLAQVPPRSSPTSTSSLPCSRAPGSPASSALGLARCLSTAPRRPAATACLSTALPVRQDLQAVGGEAVLIEQHVVVRGPVGALDAGVAVEVEVEFIRVDDVAVDKDTCWAGAGGAVCV
jgi:hypothetical protein